MRVLSWKLWLFDCSKRTPLKIHSRLGISKWDPYRQYLAYHEGWGGYSRGSYNKKPKLLKVAQKVKRQAEIYGAQLKRCRADLDKATKGWF